jgi:N-acetyl-anhydromuramyl-L-alanine amidase AmpD
MSKLKRVDYIVVHVTATPPKVDIGAREVDAMHRQRGFSSIGYHHVIRRDGRIEPGRAEDDIGAHVQGFNSVSLGVSMVGGVDARGTPRDNATPAQYRALETLLRALAERHPRAQVCGHRDLSPDGDGDGVIEPQEHVKACPCFDAVPWARARGLPAAGIRGAWDNRAPAAPRGPDARDAYLQRLLVRAGYAFGAIDGDIGPRTRSAIRQFQLWAGLPESGEFDRRTVSKLRRRFEAGAA